MSLEHALDKGVPVQSWVKLRATGLTLGNSGSNTISSFAQLSETTPDVKTAGGAGSGGAPAAANAFKADGSNVPITLNYTIINNICFAKLYSPNIIQTSGTGTTYIIAVGNGTEAGRSVLYKYLTLNKVHTSTIIGSGGNVISGEVDITNDATNANNTEFKFKFWYANADGTVKRLDEASKTIFNAGEDYNFTFYLDTPYSS